MPPHACVADRQADSMAYGGEIPLLPRRGPIIENRCPPTSARARLRQGHVLPTSRILVVKIPSGEAGGYGMLIGPHASAEEIQLFAEKDSGRST